MSNLHDILPAPEAPAPPQRPTTNPKDLYAALKAIKEEIHLRKVRAELEEMRAFVEHFWDVVEPEQTLRWNWHLDVLCLELGKLERGEITQEIMNVPPGTMKSLLVNVFFRAKLWAKNPRLRFFTASYSGHLSLRDNVKLRDIVQSAKYRKLYPKTKLKGDANAKEMFYTTAGGWSFATSVGGAGTGEHPDYVIIDDPHTAQQARSDAERQTALDWFDRTISSRGVVRKVRVIVIMQRLHNLDLSGHLLAKGGWEHVCFPMKFIGLVLDKHGKPTDTPDPRDQRTVKGELLWPELFDAATIRKLEINLGPYGAAGQLQQRPTPEGGGLFKRTWFGFVSGFPANARRRVRAWDTAGSEGAGDWTAGVRLAETPDEKLYIEDVRRDQLSPDGVDKLILQTAKLDGKSCAVREEKEPGGSGKAVTTARQRLLKGFDYNFIQLGADKVTRAKPFRSQCEAGNVFIVQTGDPARDAWIEPFLSELENFPVGEHDDQVDGASAAYNSLVLEPIIDTSLTW